MIFIDTHTHLYLNRFDEDRAGVVERAINNNVKFMLMPNIDCASVKPMLSVSKSYPENCLPMIGLHPTSVDNNFVEKLKELIFYLENNKFYAIGETGMDLYWDTSFIEEQKEALRMQIALAEKYELPIVIHSRNALTEIIDVLNEQRIPAAGGVFHCYPGDIKTAVKVIDMGFKIGVGGVVTYKKSHLPELVKKIGLDHLLLETDAPFLPPVPHRGKRNESAYIPLIAKAIAEILNVDLKEVADKTSTNALNLFNIKS